MKPKILIVDDNSMFRETTRTILKSKFPSLRVKEAENGKQAFIQIHNHPPDLVLMDIRLSEENGLELTHKIKDLYPQIVIIVFTSYDSPEYRKAAFDNGAEFFILKSELHKEKFIAVIESVLAGEV